MKCYFIIGLALFALTSCHKGNEIETFQTNRDNIIDIKNKIVEIDLGDVYANKWSRPHVTDKYLIIRDHKSLDYLLHVFDKNSFKHITSFAEPGQGPLEITNIAGVNWIEETGEIYVFDFSKYNVMAFHLDSVISYPDYKPHEKYKLNKEKLAFTSVFLNDSVSYSKLMISRPNTNFQNMTGVINYKSGEIDIKEYDREEFYAKRYNFDASFSDSIYVECNTTLDLISIFDLNGNLKRNIYGPLWDEDIRCYCGVAITNDYIFTSFDGHDYDLHILPKKCELFHKNGNYIATLNVGYGITSLCYDKDNDRIIFAFDDEIQFGYLNLKDVKIQ